MCICLCIIWLTYCPEPLFVQKAKKLHIFLLTKAMFSKDIFIVSTVCTVKVKISN